MKGNDRLGESGFVDVEATRSRIAEGLRVICPRTNELEKKVNKLAKNKNFKYFMFFEFNLIFNVPELLS